MPKGSALRPDTSQEFPGGGSEPASIHLRQPSAFLSRSEPHRSLATNVAARLASGGHPVTGQGACLGSKPHPPLPFAVLGPIRLFDTQPQRGRLRERAALADSDEPNARG